MSVSGADIVNYAATKMGDRYVFGTEGPNTFDCSGLVEYVFKHFGIKTPRVAHDQQHFGTAVARSKIQPGDLVFFNWSGGGSADHVAIYAGNGYMIQAPHTGDVVKKTKMNDYLWANEIAIRRFPGVTGGPATSEGGIGGAIGAIGSALGLGNGLSVPGVSDVTGALSGIKDGIASIAEGVGSVGKMAEMVTHLFLPSNIIRGFAMLFGLMFLLIGIFFLTREAKG